MERPNLQEMIKNHLDSLSQAVDSAARDEAMLAYLKFGARFHTYSFNNQMLIFLQSHGKATQVAGYHAWRKMGRQVQKVEKVGHGYTIWVPHKYKPKEGEKEGRTGFGTGTVFDISQTEGNPLPEAPNWKSLERRAELQTRLEAFALQRGICVKLKELTGDTQGQSRGGTIELIDTAGTKTLVHELAHELLHQKANGGERTERQIEELQAESVAYVVCAHFNLDAPGSANYLALWGAKGDAINGNLSVIQKAAAEIINGLEAEDTPAFQALEELEPA